MPGKSPRSKGIRFEREIVNSLKLAGWGAERIPLSGAMGTFKGDVQWRLGSELLKMECKVRGSGFRFLYKHLGQNDALLIKSDRASPLIILSLERLLRICNDLHNSGNRHQP